MVVVSFGTTLPELSVSITSSTTGNLGLASGTIMGSTIVNFFLVLPAAILLGDNLRIGTTKTQRSGLVLLFSVVLFLSLQKLGINHYVSGALLILGVIGSNILEYKWGVIGRVQEDKPVIDLFKKEKATPDLILGIVFSVAAVTLGGLLIVTAMEDLSAISGYSTTVLGLTLAGIATSLPDLFTAVSSQKKDEDKLTIGHIIGGSIYNLLFIGGVTNIVGGTIDISITETAFLIGAVAIFLLILRFYKGRDIPKWIGIALLLMFFIYIYAVSFSPQSKVS
jgi:cation:H+ antiporter